VPNPVAVRLFDAVLGFLLRPRARRIRRWSFLVTVPLGFFAGRALGLDLGDGVLLGTAVAILDVLVLLGVAVAGAHLLGRERRDALLDLLMHPVARRLVLAEARMLLTFPRALMRRVRPPVGATFAYHRGTYELGFALALVPAMLAEGAAVHLLLPDSWFWPKLVLATLHGYGILMLLGWAAAPRTEPHRLHDGVLELRSGHLYRARIALDGIAAIDVQRRRQGSRTGLVLGDGATARLAISGRTDVVLRLEAPVEVERPFGDPFAVTQIMVAVDDPERLVSAVRAAQAVPSTVEDHRRFGLLAWLAPADLADALA